VKVTATAGARVPTQRRARRTREALVLAGCREFSEHGHAGTTAKSIAQRAGVATGSFYQYFPNKDVLLRELARQRLALVAQRAFVLLEGAEHDPADASRLLDDIRARMRSVVELVIEYHSEDPGLHAVLSERRHADPQLDTLTSAAEHALVERIADLLERWGHDGDRLAVAYVLFGSIEGSIHAHVLGHSLVDDERFVKALVDALIRIALPPSLVAPSTASPQLPAPASVVNEDG
jgi:AcrR family transcriptional regulator